MAYNATVAVGVPGGTNLGAIPLTAEAGGPTTFQGFVTATTGSTAATIDASVSALQTFSLPGGATLTATIPAEGNSVSNISVDSNSNCPATAPSNTNCAQYTLIEPASNPSLGVFSSGKITYAAPASGDVLYSIGASAFIPLSGGADRLRSANENNEYGQERQRLESASRYGCYAQGNRFRRLLLAPIERVKVPRVLLTEVRSERRRRRNSSGCLPEPRGPR